MCPLKGEMLEWLKRHAWKACIRQKCIRGSNPRLSAEQKLKREVNTINNNQLINLKN
jgi:hypothetical protein